MKCLEDLDVVKNWNWGRYVLNAMVHHAENWSKNRKKILCGPILLLVFLYVDRMTMKGMRVPRSIPICVNWPSNELMQRQKLETDKRFFGSGSLRGPIPLPTSEDFALENVSGDIAVGVGESPERLLQARMIKISREIGEKSRFLKSVMLEASDEHRSSDVFKECVVKCSRISGLPLDEIYSGSTQADVIPPSTERQYDTGGRLETENVDIPVEEAVRDEVDIPVEEAVRDEVDIPVEEAVEQVDMPVDKEATVSEGLSNDVVLTDDLEAGLTCSAMPDKNVENENLTIEGDERDKLIGEYVTEEIHTKSSPKLCVTEQEVGNKSAVESESSYQVSTVDKSISKVQKVKIPPKIRQSQRVRKSSNDVNEGGAKEQETNPKLVKYKFTRRGRK
ncbi:uncharacterized protein LOC130992985 isoform X2 [Salvia miltiorrhiza]|uniref:uncharacterized protein LOC130992985 isoform X2 n=1 Tax=Salvia miltiorrhiza TaxID=226208 RepID=UPI0025AC4CD1|nr:uncharacterized protein LOC130992985 isoform X2 [Salvia miltiorrhiza]